MNIAIRGGEPIDSRRCRVIAEAGANHNNSVEMAIELAEAAHRAGAWAVKFQLYKAETLAARTSPKYWTDGFGTSTQFESFKLLDHLAYEDWAPVAEACQDLGIHFFATPFDLAAIDALEKMDVAMYKIASADITNKQLVRAVAETGKPVFVSTGAAELGEIETALEWLEATADRVVPLVCTLKYPSRHQDGNFARIESFRARFAPLLIGYSDHTLGVDGAWVAAALGAVAIEKHYTLDKTLPDSPDHAMSVDPAELAAMVSACDAASTLRGSAEIVVSDVEQDARSCARRSVVAVRAMRRGHVLGPEDLACKRPGTGISPSALDVVIGTRLARDVEADDILDWSDLES